MPVSKGMQMQKQRGFDGVHMACLTLNELQKVLIDDDSVLACCDIWTKACLARSA